MFRPRIQVCVLSSIHAMPLQHCSLDRRVCVTRMVLVSRFTALQRPLTLNDGLVSNVLRYHAIDVITRYRE